MNKKLKVMISALLVVVVVASQSIVAIPVKAASIPTSNLTLTSGNQFLVDSFNWAKNKALSYVRTNTSPGNIPCYFADLSDTKFCARDVAHYAEGAHLLGLDTENFSMMKLFAWGANRRVSGDYYWPRWQYPYNGNADGLDKGDSCQWRTLPTAFDLAWRAYDQYLWTGDSQWINDQEMFNFYTNVQTNFMQHQNYNNDEVADETVQLASYFEFPNSDEHFISAGDSIGCQYQSLLAYANVLSKRGDTANAQVYRDKANHLRAYFETYWYDNTAGRYIRGFDKFTNFKSDWGHENSFFMPMTLITDQGPRTDTYLDFIDKSVDDMAVSGSPLNIEATTYLPEVFYKYGRNEQGWKYLKYDMKSLNGYPEVPFTIIGNTISGMMGVTPDAPNNKVCTIPRLSSEVPWVEVNHVPIGGNDLRIRHDGNNMTTLGNNSGNTIKWAAQFYGNYSQLMVNGAAQNAVVTTLNGKTISYVTVDVAPGSSVVVKTVGTSGTSLTPPASPQLQPKTPPTAPTIGVHYLSDMNADYATSGGNPVQWNKSENGNPIMINGSTYSKGIGTHAESAIKYQLFKQYSRLKCDIGFQDSTQTTGSARFVIYGGTNTSSLLYDSGIMHRGDTTKSIDIDVSGCDYIVLGVKNAGDGNDGDSVNWANARLVAGNDAQPPTAPSNLTVSNVTPDSLQLNWTTSTDNVGVTGYSIYNGTNLLGTTTSNNYKVTGLTPNTAYSFTVKAKDVCENESAASNVLNVTTPQEKITYLSNLSWVSGTAGSGSVKYDRSVDGNTITLNGKAYAKGIGTHANSNIIYDLGGQHLRFKSIVGVDDEVIGNQASVIFQVFADGKKIFDSGRMTNGDEAKIVDVSVAGVNELQLIVTDAGDGINSDHADWADAKLDDFSMDAQQAYLSDLNWISATTGSGTVHKDKSVDGNIIKLNDKTYTKGIGTHATSEIVYNLGGRYSRFISDVGVDDEVGANSTIVFQVYVDGKKVFDSGIMTPTSITKTVDISVAGANEMKLVVTDGGDGINSDHADWANARLN